MDRFKLRLLATYLKSIQRQNQKLTIINEYSTQLQ